MNKFVLACIALCLLSSSFAVPNKKKRAAESKIKKERLAAEEKRENFILRKKLHKLKVLSQKAIKRLSNLNDYSTFYSKYLTKILRVRVPGTVGHHAVKKFICDTLNSYGWNVQKDEFNAVTPLGEKKFTNIIATLNQKADRTLALAAHYDSKLMKPENGKYFLGATDSAVPCAMLLDFAKLLADKWEKSMTKTNDVSPMLLFIDGEEAFVSWTKNDSIYGSHHLAQVFSQQLHQKRSLADNSVTMLDSMDAFVLFDLIGAKDPQFLNLHQDTSYLYNALSTIEYKLHKSGEINNQAPYFPGAPNRPLYLEDDHIPFLQRNVPILHLIPIPFPDAWHKLDDDESTLDQSTIENLLKIFRQFLLEYFHFES